MVQQFICTVCFSLSAAVEWTTKVHCDKCKVDHPICPKCHRENGHDDTSE